MKKIFTLVAAAVAAVSMNAQNYTLRTLTFEDGDYASKSANYLGKYNWSSLIDNPQYGGELLYGENHGDTSKVSTSVNYKWYDEGNTYLYSELPENWGTKMYWGGGHAISNYWDGNLSNGDYNNQLAVYVKDDNGYGIGGHGHNGSNNFAVHYGYRDNSGYSASNLPTLSFGDGVARVIDHMYVNINTYLANALINGNDLTSKLGADDYIGIEATGYKEDGSKKTIKFPLADGTDYTIDQWTKWDMQKLGEVKKVEFNVVGTSDNGYGFSMPAYFCYDDVAVQFPTTETASNARANNQPNAQSEETSTELKKLTLIADWGVNERFAGDVPEGATHQSVNESSYGKDAFVSTDEGKTCEVTIGNLPAGITLEKIELTFGFSDIMFGEANLTGYVNDEAIGVLNIGGKRSNAENKFTTVAQTSFTRTVFADKLPIKDVSSFKLKIEALIYDTGFDYIDLYYTVANPDGITETAADTKKQDNAYYDLQGRRIQAPQHGIYIHNGKKYVK